MEAPGLGLVAAMVVIAAPLGAQTPTDRTRLEALRAELAGVTDSTALGRREQTGIDRARADRDNALLHLELGFVAYRLGEVTQGRRHFDDAAGEFEWAAELEPSWPYPWYGLGLAELALGEHGTIAVENLRQALGKDFLSKAARAFARATQADPTFVRAVLDLAETAMRQRVRPRLEVALEALRAVAASPTGATPAVHLARGRIEREVGEGDSALAAFGAYLAAGGDPPLGALERARTLFFLSRADEARAAYYRGAGAGLSDSARAAYREDVAWIAADGDLAAFDALPGTEVEDWLRDFWQRRDAAEGRAPGDRLEEHYRRFFYAWRQFRLVSRHRRYTTEPYRSAQTVFDDRGVIYVRHGEPSDRARYVAPGAEPNESWLYRRPGRNLIFHFVALGDVQDFKLVESLAAVLGLDSAIVWQAEGRLPPSAQTLYDTRAHLDPVYRRIATSPTAQGTILATERSWNRDAIRVGTTTDSYTLRFARELESHLRVYAVGGSDHGAQLLFVFAVPGARLSAQAVGAGTVYPVQIRLSHLEPGERAAFLDTTRAFFTAQPLGAAEYLTGFLEIPTEAGLHSLRVVLMEPDGRAGDVVDLDSVAVPAFDGEGLSISDLVLGDVGAGLVWPIVGDTIPLSPLGRYAPGSSLELYYEVHGLPPGTRYRARVEVRGKRSGSIFAKIGRLFGGGGPAVAFAFEDVSTGRTTRARQTVNLAPLAPGDYTLTLIVEDPAGDARHRRDVRFHVTDR